MNNSHKQINRLLVLLAVLLLPLAGARVLTLNQADAASVTLAPANSALALAGGEVTFTYTATTAVEGVGTTYEFIVSPALPSALSDCASADVQADTTSGGAGAFSGFTTTDAIFTTTSATTTTGRSLCLTFPAETVPNSYSVFISSSTGDYGLAMVHYGENNVVNVSATVASTLSFNIVDLTDTTDENLCQLGNVTTLTAVNLDATDDGIGECGYALAIGTNANAGFSVEIQGSANGLYNGLSTMATVSGAFDTGTEEYGLANVTAPAGITVAGAFDTSTAGAAIPTSATTFITAAAPFTYTAGTDATDVTKVMHGLTVGSGTQVGSYTETITYTVSANF